MRLKWVKLVMVTWLITGLPLVSLLAQGEKDVYYICFDNSWSMKRYDFYPRLIGSLIGLLKRDGIHNDLVIKYIPFGTRFPLKVIDRYDVFSRYISAKNDATTDFANLTSTLEREINKHGQKRPTVIIISDGEHDISKNLPFSQLSSGELEQMQEVFKRMKGLRVPVYTVHILKDFPGVQKPRRIAQYFLELSNSKLPPGSEVICSDKNIIAALSMDFMEQLAGEGGKTYLCRSNKDGVKAFIDIFGLSLPFDCDISSFSPIIPLNVRFEGVERHVQQWFLNEIQASRFCAQGVERRLQVTGERSLFQVKVVYVNRETYNLYLNSDITWKERRISIPREMDICIAGLKNNIEEKIETEYNNDSRFMIPHCLTGIKFEDPRVYAFLSAQNFKLRVNRCHQQQLEETEVFFFDDDHRVYILLPLIVAERLFITAPGKEDNLNQGASIAITQEIFNSWEGNEAIIRDGAISYPTFQYDFARFFNTFPGDILFFSYEKKRFYGIVGRTIKQNRLDFFQGGKYKIYFVPASLSTQNIKVINKELKNSTDVQDALELLKPSPIDVVFTDWEECLYRYEKASPDSGSSLLKLNTRDTVARQVSASNGYLFLLLHLGDIMNDPVKKTLFLELLGRTISIYKGMESPFEVIELFQVDIPIFSRHLKECYANLLARGSKISTIIQVLANPISNLTELKYYIEGNYQMVSRENQRIFKELEGR